MGYNVYIIWAQEADVFPYIKLVLLCRIFVYNTKS